MSRRRSAASGSITPIVAYVCLLVSIMGIGASTLGRLVVAKSDAQEAADAAALGSIDAVREAGKATDPSGAYAMGRANARLPIQVTRTLAEIPGQGEGVGHMVSTAVATTEIDAPRFIFPDGVLQVTARARADIEQERKLNGERLTPKVALVLDYSGSMSGQPIETQEKAVREHLLEQHIGKLDLEFAAVLFNDTLVDSVGFEPDAVQTILDFFTKYDAGGGTRTDLGLDKAAEILGGPDGRPRFVILVSDGSPNDRPAAEASSSELWNKTEATVLTLHIGGGGDAENFMVSVSGKPDERGDRSYYYPVTNLDDFEKALADIISAIACNVTPLDPDALKDPKTVRVFLEPPGGGREVRLQPVDDLASNRTVLGFKFNPQSRILTFTNAACILINDEHHRAVVRYNRSQLIE